MSLNLLSEKLKILVQKIEKFGPKNGNCGPVCGTIFIFSTLVLVITGRLRSALGADQTTASYPIVNQDNNGDHVVTGHDTAGSYTIIYSKDRDTCG